VTKVEESLTIMKTNAPWNLTERGSGLITGRDVGSRPFTGVAIRINK